MNIHEKRVLQLIFLPTKLIAKKLYLSEHTVKTYIHRLLKKYKQKNRLGLFIKALKLNYLNIKDVDIGFWDKDGKYIESIEVVDFSKE